MQINPLHAVDFYKPSHEAQYAKGTELVYSNFTPRSNKLSNLPEDGRDGIVFFGDEYFYKNFLVDIWNREFFHKPKDLVLNRFARRMKNALGKYPREEQMSKLEKLYNLGYLPIEIRAVKEGTFVPIGVPALSIKNTILSEDFSWLTNYLETVLSSCLWKPCTSATTARYYRKLCEDYAAKTCDNTDHIQFQCHDFSFRGMSGLEDPAVSGAAHLTSFSGTDSVLAIDLLEDFYGANSDKELVGASVPATEHSVMCMGTKEGEIETFRRLINETYPDGIVSIVSDTWDFWKVIGEYLPELKPEIMARDGKVVIRPDSGDPVDIICGACPVFEDLETAKEKLSTDYSFHELDQYMNPLNDNGCNEITVFVKDENSYYKFTVILTQGYYYDSYSAIQEYEKVEPSLEAIGAIEALWNIFGGIINSKGYKVLDPHIGLIYGDSITPERAKRILERLEVKGFASSNIVFGVGSFTYTYVTRDTWGFAVKATAGIVNGEVRQIFKDPATDTGKTKKSLKGFFGVYLDKDSGQLYVVDNLDEEPYDDCLEVRFRNGVVYGSSTLQEIRNRVSNGL